MASPVFTIDLCKGPARQYEPPATPQPVSPYVYGINAGKYVATATKFGMIRQGGDDNSAYNWTNDYSNSGGDYCYYQGVSDNGNLAGRYTDATGDTIPAALAKGEAFLATVPILDFVAATYDRNTGWDTATSASACPTNPSLLESQRWRSRQRGRRSPRRPGLWQHPGVRLPERRRHHPHRQSRIRCEHHGEGQRVLQLRQRYEDLRRMHGRHQSRGPG